MKPKHLQFRINPTEGRILAVHEQRGKPVKLIRDVHDDVLLCLCADLSADNVSREVAQEVRFSDGMVCKITVEMTQAPDMAVRERLDREFADGVGNGVEVVA